MTGFSVQPLAGGDVLRRSGEVVVLASAAGDPKAIDNLFAVIDESSAVSVDGRAMLRRLARYLTDDATDAPSFVVLAPAGDDVAVLVHGDAEAVIETASGQRETLSGRTSATWVDRIVEWPAGAIRAVTSASREDQPAPRSELLAGVIAAGGFVVVPEAGAGVADHAAPADLSSTAATRVPAADFESISLLPDEDTEPREPLPLAGEAPPPADRDSVMVKGVMCKRGHFNSPLAAFCGVCGISMVQQTHELVDGPRPPLGVIVFDDGTTFGLDADYVIGREPENDTEVSSGRLRGLTIDDPGGSVSRVHALIRLDAWDVVVIDRESANGTRISPAGGDAWVALAPHEAAVIQPGTTVQLGDRTFTFDAHFRV